MTIHIYNNQRCPAYYVINGVGLGSYSLYIEIQAADISIMDKILSSHQKPLNIILDIKDKCSLEYVLLKFLKNMVTPTLGKK